MNVVITNRQRTRKINQRLLKEITESLLEKSKIEAAELGVNLVASREMTLINETFLRHKGPTDVITFDYLNAGRSARGAQPNLHGEIFICIKEAVLQSKIFKTNWQTEVVRYIVHGILHLLGHDDKRVAARRKMKRTENRFVSELSRRFALSKL